MNFPNFPYFNAYDRAYHIPPIANAPKTQAFSASLP